MVDIADLVKAARARHVIIYGKKRQPITDVLADTVEAQAAEIARLHDEVHCLRLTRNDAASLAVDALEVARRRIARQRRVLAKLYQRRHEKNAEIALLYAALATARREGMEEAATIASQRRALNNQAQSLREGAHDKKGAAEASIEAHEAAEIAAAIRAAAKEGK